MTLIHLTGSGMWHLEQLMVGPRTIRLEEDPWIMYPADVTFIVQNIRNFLNAPTSLFVMYVRQWCYVRTKEIVKCPSYNSLGTFYTEWRSRLSIGRMWVAYVRDYTVLSVCGTVSESVIQSACMVVTFSICNMLIILQYVRTVRKLGNRSKGGRERTSSLVPACSITHFPS